MSTYMNCRTFSLGKMHSYNHTNIGNLLFPSIIILYYSAMLQKQGFTTETHQFQKSAPISLEVAGLLLIRKPLEEEWGPEGSNPSFLDFKYRILKHSIKSSVEHSSQPARHTDFFSNATYRSGLFQDLNNALLDKDRATIKHYSSTSKSCTCELINPPVCGAEIRGRCQTTAPSIPGCGSAPPPAHLQPTSMHSWGGNDSDDVRQGTAGKGSRLPSRPTRNPIAFLRLKTSEPGKAGAATTLGARAREGVALGSSDPGEGPSHRKETPPSFEEAGPSDSPLARPPLHAPAEPWGCFGAGRTFVHPQLPSGARASLAAAHTDTEGGRDGQPNTGVEGTFTCGAPAREAEAEQQQQRPQTLPREGGWHSAPAAAVPLPLPPAPYTGY